MITKEYAAKYREDNRELLREKSKDYRKRNIEKLKSYHNRYYQDNKTKIAIYRRNNKSRWMFNSARDRASKKNLPFDIVLTDVIIPERCPILDIPLIVDGNRGRNYKDSPTLDRIIPEKGYVRGNIQVISDLANRMKNDATNDQIIQLGKWAEKYKENLL